MHLESNWLQKRLLPSSELRCLRMFQQLRSFFGFLLNYYCKFFPSLITILQPLNDLLLKDKKWSWSAECTQLSTLPRNCWLPQTCSHTMIQLTITSQYGLGAVISHMFPNGEERSIAFESRSFSKARRISLRLIRRRLLWSMVCRNFTPTCLTGNSLWKLTTNN